MITRLEEAATRLRSAWQRARLNAAGARIGHGVVFGRGVRIDARALEIGDGVHLGDGVSIRAEEVSIGPHCLFFPSVRVLSVGRFAIGAHGKLSQGVVLKGRSISIGDEFWMNAGAEVGGGGWRAEDGYLRVGHRCHIGRGSHVNVADAVELGNDSAIGMDCTLATHAHWQPVTLGYLRKRGPILIGSDVAIYSRCVIAPGVSLGDGAALAAGSVALESVPAGAFAGGAPARVLRAQPPKPPGDQLVSEILAAFAQAKHLPCERRDDGSLAISSPTSGETLVYDRGQAFGELWRSKPRIILVTFREPAPIDRCQCRFDLDRRELSGQSSALSEALRNFLFSYGLRFSYRGGYQRRPFSYRELLESGVE